MSGSKPSPTGGKPPEPEEKSDVEQKSGRVTFDARGNAVWEWAMSTGIFGRNVDAKRLKKLEAPELKIAEEREALALVNEFLGAPGPADVPAWVEYQTAQAEEKRAVALARDLLLRERTLEDDRREAEAGIRQTLESIAGVPG